MKKDIKKYRLVLFLIVLYSALYFIDLDLFNSSVTETKNNLWEMIQIIPPVFLLLGLLDVWVPRETMIKMMGKGSGLKGVLLAFFMGSAAAGPLYAAFPIAVMLLKKGSSFRNVFIMIGAWSTTKIPLLMFETSSLGLNFMLIRLSLSIVGILVIAYLSELILGHEECEAIIAHSQTIETH